MIVKKAITKSKQGKKNRAAGVRFELKVRNKLETDGWIVDKWTNNVDLEERKLVKAKRKFNPFLKAPGFCSPKHFFLPEATLLFHHSHGASWSIH